jgi:hypothetical protein
MLERTGVPWLIGMYETYFDDSGTNAQSDIAIAACYVSTESGWRRFVSEWNVARQEFCFDVFHMAEFVAPRNQGHKPWCDLDNTKKERVFQRLAQIINDNKRIGIAAAVPKAVYDKVPERIRLHYGREHYMFAIRACLMKISLWREKSLMTSLPMQYIFDWEEPGTPKHIEITENFSTVHNALKPLFGLHTGGWGFQRKQFFLPLQSADILAWQMNCYMPKIYPQGETVEAMEKHLHPGFKLLRIDQEMDLAFFNEENLGAWLKRIEDHEAKYGVII